MKNFFKNFFKQESNEPQLDINKLDSIALKMFFEKYEKCTETQQKHILKKYYQEEEKIGVCQSCGTACDYDVFNCTSCNAPLDKPLRSKQHGQYSITNVNNIVIGNNNVTVTNVVNSNINIR
jgi:hypothetical protein